MWRSVLLVVGLWIGLAALQGTPLTAASCPQPVTALRDRYGAGTSGDPAQLPLFGLSWLYGGTDPRQPLPLGVTATYLLPVDPPLDEATLATWVKLRPGGFWLIGNEPNVPAEHNTAPTASASPEVYADVLAGYSDTIKRLDPKATLIGPNIINWSFTCDGCPGFQSGLEWTNQMRAAYLDRYNQEPPIDIWGIHLYDLDWVTLPNGNAARQIDQLLSFRNWLDAVPASRGAPIWITEIGIHWGFPGFRFEHGNITPTGDYDIDHVEAYMRSVFSWLNEHSAPLRIERWFVWLLSVREGEVEDGYATWGGITLMNGPGIDAEPTRLGRVLQELSQCR